MPKWLSFSCISFTVTNSVLSIYRNGKQCKLKIIMDKLNVKCLHTLAARLIDFMACLPMLGYLVLMAVLLFCNQLFRFK